MRLKFLIIAVCLALAGCTTTAQRDASTETRGYERGYRQAVKEQYWIIQNQQRTPVPNSRNP